VSGKRKKARTHGRGTPNRDRDLHYQPDLTVKRVRGGVGKPKGVFCAAKKEKQTRRKVILSTPKEETRMDVMNHRLEQKKLHGGTGFNTSTSKSPAGKEVNLEKENKGAGPEKTHHIIQWRSGI